MFNGQHGINKSKTEPGGKMEKNQKRYISASQLQMYERCGEQYYRRYILKEKIPPGISLLKGTGVHGGARANFRQKVESKQDLPRKDIVEIAVTEFERSFDQQGVLLTAEEETIGLKKVLGETKDSVVKLADLYAVEIAPAYQPVFVEESYRIVIENSLYDLLAIMDLADEQERVVDLKTGAKSKTQKDVDTSEQLTFYALVYKAKTKRLPKEVRLETLVDTKVAKVQTLFSTRDDEDLRVLVERVNTMIQGLEKGVFVPAQPTSWVCDERYCGYAPTCRYYKKR
jgi:hypothetical protein